MIRDELIQRAQKLTNVDGKVRYVNYTSKGWWIEFQPVNKEGLSFKIEPK